MTLIDSSVSSAEALSGLKTRNLLGADTYINLIGFGAYARNRKDFWSFGLSLRTSAEVNLPYSLFDFIKNGHEGSIRDIGVAADSYLEAAFSYSFPAARRPALHRRARKVPGGNGPGRGSRSTASTSRSRTTAGPSMPQEASTFRPRG